VSNPINGAMAAPRRYLVLGGGGFIGSHLVDTLLKNGHYVRCFDRPNTQLIGASHRRGDKFELYPGDFASEADIAGSLEGCEVCFHLIATTLPKSSNADPVFDVESNVIGTVRLLDHAVKSGLRKIVFVSSGGTVYGVPEHIPILESHPTDPVCSYGITKLAIEKYLQLFHTLHGIDYAILRLANPFGERQRLHASQGAIAVFLGKVLRGETVEIWGDGSVVRDYIYIQDVIDALVVAADETRTEHVFNIGSGRGHSLNELLGAIEKVTGLTAGRRYLPSRTFDVPTNVLSIDKAKRLLNWEPKVSFEDGLRIFTDWLRTDNLSADFH
jgi:UDP-glucose 4-epimerase